MKKYIQFAMSTLMTGFNLKLNIDNHWIFEFTQDISLYLSSEIQLILLFFNFFICLSVCLFLAVYCTILTCEWFWASGVEWDAMLRLFALLFASTMLFAGTLLPVLPFMSKSELLHTHRYKQWAITFTRRSFSTQYTEWVHCKRGRPKNIYIFLITEGLWEGGRHAHMEPRYFYPPLAKAQGRTPVAVV